MQCEWVTDVTGSSEAVEESLAENSPDSQSHMVCQLLMQCEWVTDVTGSSEAVEESLAENSPDSQSHMPLRANTTTQVCWHRTTTVGMADMQAMLKVR